MEFELNKSLEILERTPTVLESLLLGLSSDWLNSNEGKGPIAGASLQLVPLYPIALASLKSSFP